MVQVSTKAAFAPLKSQRHGSAWACETFEHLPLLMGSTPSGLTGNRARGAEAIDVPRTIWLAPSPNRAEPPASRAGMSATPGRLDWGVA